MAKRKRRRHAAPTAAEAAIGPVIALPPRSAGRSSAGDQVAAVLRMMQDESQPAALRARMANAAMAAREADRAAAGGPPDPYGRPVNLERAKRIAVILSRANDELRARELAAQGRDVKVRGIPVDDTDWPRFLARIAAMLDTCTSLSDDLDSAGIRF